MAEPEQREEREDRHSEAQEELGLLLSSGDDGLQELTDLDEEIRTNIDRLGHHEALMLARNLVDRMLEISRQNRRYLIATNERITQLNAKRDAQIAAILAERVAALEKSSAESAVVNREFLALKSNTAWAFRILFAAAAALITNELLQFIRSLLLHH